MWYMLPQVQYGFELSCMELGRNWNLGQWDLQVPSSVPIPSHVPVPKYHTTKFKSVL